MERRYDVTYADMVLGQQSEGYKIYPIFFEIEREVPAILQGMPQEQAVAIANAATREMPSSSGNTHIPEVIIFSREGDNPEKVWEKLLSVLKTPDYDTPSFIPEFRPYIDALKAIMYRSGYADGISGAIASAHILRVAGGDPAAINWPYRDRARRFSQYSDEWVETLERQFNGAITLTGKGSETEKEVFSLLEANKRIARIHESLHNSRKEGEDTFSYLVRKLDETVKLSETLNVDFSTVSRLLDRGWRDYRKETYALRGIPYEY